MLSVNCKIGDIVEYDLTRHERRSIDCEVIKITEIGTLILRPFAIEVFPNPDDIRILLDL